MEDLLANAPKYIYPISILVFGFFAVASYFDKGMRAKDVRKEEKQVQVNATEDRLVDLYKKEVEELRKLHGDNEQIIKEHTRRIVELETEHKVISAKNKMLEEIFQGRDKETVAKIDAILSTVKAMSESMTRLAEATAQSLGREKTVVIKS
jgi:uncharacterized Fe-S cluster-containing radical SAM superfamily protein